MITHSISKSVIWGESWKSFNLLHKLSFVDSQPVTCALYVWNIVNPKLKGNLFFINLLIRLSKKLVAWENLVNYTCKKLRPNSSCKLCNFFRAFETFAEEGAHWNRDRNHPWEAWGSKIKQCNGMTLFVDVKKGNFGQFWMLNKIWVGFFLSHFKF